MAEPLKSPLGKLGLSLGRRVSVTLITVSVLSKSLKSPQTVGEEGDKSSPDGGSLPSLTGDKLMLEVKTLEEFMEFMEEVKLVSRASEPRNPLSSLVKEFEGDILFLEEPGAWLVVEEMEEARLLRDLTDSPKTEADEEEHPEGGCRTKSTEEDDETLLRRNSASMSSSCPFQGKGMPSSWPSGIEWLSHSFSHSQGSTRLETLPTLFASKL